MGILHQYAGIIRPVGVDALCPFGAVESAITLATTGEMIQKIAWSSFILLFATLAVAIVFRRAFCGSICAFGTLQELFGKLGKVIFLKRFTMPAAMDKPARYLKYAVLAAIIVLSAVTGTLIIRPYDPWASWNHLLSAELFTGFLVGFIVLAVSLLGSLLYDRFFCKYLCPMGGFLGLINRIGWFRVRRVEATCTHCHACDKACPVNIHVESMAQVQSSECINCNLCVSACPVKDTLMVAGPRKVGAAGADSAAAGAVSGGDPRGRISPLAALLITLALFSGVVLASILIGDVSWTQKTIEKIVEQTKTMNPDDIKGSDTFKAVSELSGIPKTEFLTRFRISEEAFENSIKDAAHAVGSGFDTEDVRAFVRERLQR